jgi:UDP-3-O-[3-hydroxymyristoyl] N-acetylglucosamine deacetylase
MRQKTLRNSIFFSGIGLHSGAFVNVTINPAEANTGIIFRRTDIVGKQNEIKALYDYVVDTNLGTTIGLSNFYQKFTSKMLSKFGIFKEYGLVVKTIEHFMASLWACDIDNAIIDINNKEIPILDGSADIFVKEIQRAKTQELDLDRKFLVVKKEIEVSNDFGSIKLIPYNDFCIDLSVDFKYGSIGKQTYSFDGKQSTFLEEISRARTFGNIKDIRFMQRHGLARGGTYDSAMIFDENKILNKEGLRFEFEPVKHKLLDCIGDMFTSGYFMKCHIIGNKSGHSLNNRILRKLFADSNNYEIQ